METISPPLVVALAATVVWACVVVYTDVRLSKVRAVAAPGEALVEEARWVGRIGNRAVAPLAAVTAAALVWSAQRHDWGLRGPWWFDATIALGLVALFASTIWRPARARLISKIAEGDGADAEDVHWVARQIGMLARGEVAMLALIALLLVLQPS